MTENILELVALLLGSAGLAGLGGLVGFKWKARLEKIKLKTAEIDLDSKKDKASRDALGRALTSLDEANITIVRVLDDKIQAETDKAVLFQAVLNISVNCEDCANSEIEKLPNPIKAEILNRLGR